jgi:zinc/manganese transport system permease protein
MDPLSVVIWPLLACLILAGIHAWLGVHIVERGVVFAGLLLPQFAALGAALAYVTGHDVPSAVTWFWSLGFTILGAAILAMTRGHRETRIPQEAILAIVYAVSAAVAVVAMSKAPQDAEHLKDMLVGNILTVDRDTVIKMAVLYALVGLFHLVFRKTFLAISACANPGQEEHIPNLKLWDFLFYASLGVVVTSSVAIAGVLLVFSYLIVPPVAAMMFAGSMGKRLAIGWTTGASVSAAGVMLSIQADLPTSASIVCAFGVVILLLAFVRLGIRSRTPGRE